MISRNVPIRFDVETIRKIDCVAEAIGLTRSGLVKVAVALQLRAVRSGQIDVSSVLTGVRHKPDGFLTGRGN